MDDDPFVTTLYKARLQHEGFMVDALNDSREAISKLEQFMPDLLVLDLHMPVVSGVDLLRQIRSSANTHLRTLPVVVLSSGHVRDLIDEVGPLGVQKIFVKMQCPPNTLIAGIKEVLANHSRKRNSLDAAAEATGGFSTASLSGLLEQFTTSDKQEDLHNLLLEIYKAAWTRISKGLRDDETTPRGKLSRALQKLIQDLYDHPEHITPSTKETVSKGLNKLAQFDEEVLGSETALKNLLADLN